MNIFVTGGTGFIGHNVVKILQREHTVTTYDNETTYGILDPKEVRLLHNERAALLTGECITGDICEPHRLDTSLHLFKPEVVIHLASFPRAKVVNTDPVNGSEVMSTALLSLLTLCKKYNVRRFVYISSSMVYGDFESGVTEDTVCKPKGLYAILKYAGELLVKEYCTANNMEYVIVRPSAVYGPRDVEDRVVSKFVAAAVNNADITVYGQDEALDFTYVTDVASGIAMSATHPNTSGKTFNMTHGVEVTLLDAAKIIVNAAESRSKIIIANRDPLFPRRGALSISAAIATLNYTPLTRLEDGIVPYLKWVRIFYSKLGRAIPN